MKFQNNKVVVLHAVILKYTDRWGTSVILVHFALPF